jgi:hypothetical protein
MTNLELALNTVSEVATTALSKQKKPKGFKESEEIAKEGAKTAKVAREQLEKSLGKSVISDSNAKGIKQKVVRKIGNGEDGY